MEHPADLPSDRSDRTRSDRANGPAAVHTQGRLRDGVLMLLVLHLLQLVWLMDEPIMIWLIFITQLAYVVPASIVLAVKGRWSTLGGLWLGAVGTAAISLLLARLVFGSTTGIGG